MAPPSPRETHAAAGTLLVGPGPRAEDLALVLGALAAPRGVVVRSFADVADLAQLAETSGVCLLDVDAVPIEDVGYVRRFLAARADFDVVLLGADPHARTARHLGARRFTAWPPDVDELLALVQAAGGTSAGRAPASAGVAPATARPDAGTAPPRVRAPDAATSAMPTPRASAAVTLDGDELDQVRAILEQTSLPPPAAWPAGRAAAECSETERRGGAESPGAARARFDVPVESELEDRDDPDERDEPDERDNPDERDDPDEPWLAQHAPVLAPAAPAAATATVVVTTTTTTPAAARRPLQAPPWWRAQVADLADAAQRIDLSVRALAEAAPEIDEGDLDEARDRLRALEAEVARLMQFTRTLGYVASPPPTGTQQFDLGEIVHLFAAGLAQSGPEAPRCQYKTVPAALVRSDRQLLSQALDAIFFLVRCTSRKGDLVRAQVQRVEDPAGVMIELSLDFPAGPLEGLPEDEIVEPYALSDLFPELGPNALAAAAGIVSGQGGSLGLSSKAVGRMTWRLRLPRLET